MSALQEVLAVLLGAESEGKRIVDEAKNESSALLRTTQDNFGAERENRMASAREQARSVMETALTAAKTEAEQISTLGKEERERMSKRFNENADAVVTGLITETVDKILTGGD